MNGVIKNYRRGKNTQHENQYVIEVDGVESKAQASVLTGKKVTWTSSGNTKIIGKVMASHGSSGAVRAKFLKGLPGQAIGTRVVVQ